MHRWQDIEYLAVGDDFLGVQPLMQFRSRNVARTTMISSYRLHLQGSFKSDHKGLMTQDSSTEGMRAKRCSDVKLLGISVVYVVVTGLLCANVIGAFHKSSRVHMFKINVFHCLSTSLGQFVETLLKELVISIDETTPNEYRVLYCTSLAFQPICL